jgi:hypothetical protein
MVKNKNDRVELEIKIMKYRSLARRVVHEETEERIKLLVSELEQKLREIDEWSRKKFIMDQTFEKHAERSLAVAMLSAALLLLSLSAALTLM